MGAYRRPDALVRLAEPRQQHGQLTEVRSRPQLAEGVPKFTQSVTLIGRRPVARFGAAPLPLQVIVTLNFPHLFCSSRTLPSSTTYISVASVSFSCMM